jgi:mono/diheme cytochrome c family protein
MLAAVAMALAVTAALVGGCGREKSADVVQGKALFVQKCGSCHILARASSKGVTGPNLDNAFGSARRAGQGEKTIQGVVEDQISHARRDSVMPRNLVKGQAASDVSAYVAMVAGVPGKDTGTLATAGAPKVSTKPIPEKGGSLSISADPTGALAFASTMAKAQAGSLEIQMPNPASIQHDIAIKGPGVAKAGPRVGKGGVSKLSVSVKPGKYTFYCTVPGHEAGGMKGTLTVN